MVEISVVKVIIGVVVSTGCGVTVVEGMLVLIDSYLIRGDTSVAKNKKIFTEYFGNSLSYRFSCIESN